MSGLNTSQFLDKNGSDGAPEHLFFDDIEELHPWRTPEDCIGGCMALPTSVDFLLQNVAAARGKSLSTMYKIKRTESYGGESSVGNSRTYDGGAMNGLHGEGSGLNGSGLGLTQSGTYSAVVMKSKRSQRKAAEKVAGATLIDLARSSVDGSSALSPQRESVLASQDAHLAGSPSSLEVVRSSVNGDLLRLSSGSTSAASLTRGGGGGARTCGSFGTVLGNKGRGQFHSLSRSQSHADAPPSQPLDAASLPSSHNDMVLTGEKGGDFLIASSSLPRSPRPTKSQAASSRPLQQPVRSSSAERRSTSSPVPVVPEIPNFEQFLSEKEKLLKELEARDRASGKPPAAAMRTKSAANAINSDAEDDSNGVHDYQDMVNTQAGLALNSPRSTRTSPSPPSVAPLTAKGIGGPSPAIGQAAAQEARPQHPHVPTPSEEALPSSSSSSSSSEMEADHASEANFGENGHYVCVPGDTLNNRYTLIHQLGIGRSSRVWLAVDLEQCSPSRRQLIKSLGEEKVRKLFSPKDRPMFAAIKVFRCGDTYGDCAMYESRVMEYIKDNVKRSGAVGAGARRRQSLLLEASHNGGSGEGVVGGPSEGAFNGLASARGGLASQRRNSQGTPVNSARMGGNGMANSTTPAMSLGIGGLSARQHQHHRISSSIGSVGGWSFGASVGPGVPGVTTSHYADHLALMRDHFEVEGDYGTHHCIVMDVVGAGVDQAINETHLRGLPLDVVRSIMATSLQGLAVLSALHIIHTDIKPENLLFMDLESKTASEMDSFQRARLDPSATSQLWSSSVHQRTSVAEYAAATASTRSGSNHAAVPAPHPHHLSSPSDDHHHNAGPSFRGELSIASTAEQQTQSNQHSRHPSLSLGITALPRQQQPQQQQQQLNSPENPSTDNARTLYEVRVSDYGLSFIVPPALREGIDVMKAVSQECIEAQRRRREEKKSSKKGPPNGRERRRRGSRSPPPRTKTGRRSQSGAVAAAARGEEAEDEEESTAPATVDENDDEGDAVMVIDPMDQFKAMQRHHQKLLDEAQKRAEAEERELRRRRAGDEADGSAADQFTSVIAERDAVHTVDGDVYDALSAAITAQLRSNDTQPYLDSGRYGKNKHALGGDNVASHRYSEADIVQDSPASLRDGGAGNSLNGSMMESGWSPQSTRYARRRSSLGSLAAPTQRPPSETELSILREQIYTRGITIQSREYRAPEVILGLYFLPSCDIWSIGCVAYELVTGHFLFDIAEEYAAAVEKRVMQRKEQRRRLRRCQVYDRHDSHTDEEEDEEGGRPGRYGRRRQARSSDGGRSEDNDDTDDLDSLDSEEEDLLHAPLYFVEEPEKDLDVVHLKCMMRLIGPPPLALLNATPRGVFTDLFFDDEGTFLFLQNYSLYDNEEVELGVEAIARYREAELRAAGQGIYCVPPGVQHAHYTSNAIGSPLDVRFADTVTGGTLGSSTGNAIVYHYSDDDDDEFEKELAKTVGGGAVVRHVHTGSALNTVTSVGGGGGGGEEDNKEAREGSALIGVNGDQQPEGRSHSTFADEATPSTASRSPSSVPSRNLALDGEFAHDSTGIGSTTSTLRALPTGGGTLPPPERTARGRDPSDSSNYPIITEGWKKLQGTIREHIDSEDEAKSFEEFLLLCFQWDPAKRAKPTDLLQSRWLTHYGPLATTASLMAAAPEDPLSLRKAHGKLSPQ